MEKILEIDICDENDLFECYNKKKISKELIKYMIDSVPKLSKDDTLKVVINNKMKNNIRCAELIKKAMDEACKKQDFRFHNNNLKQISFCVVGIAALILASFIKWNVLNEIILIGAWVLLWDVVEMEIVDDVSNRRNKKTMKKILSCEFIENR